MAQRSAKLPRVQTRSRAASRVRSMRRRARDLVNHAAILAAGTGGRDGPRISYGHRRVPGPEEVTRGGMVKFQRLARYFPHQPYRFNVLYLGSSSLPRDWRRLEWLARRKGAAILYNQDGVAYPGWHGPGWEEANRPQARLNREAEFVFYQSRFCQLSADRFLGERTGASQVLLNAVDTDFFRPSGRRDLRNPLTLLLGGNQYQWYRLETAIRMLSCLRYSGEPVRLLVSGRLNWTGDPEQAMAQARGLATELKVEDTVEFTGPFTQATAPELYQRADILVHTKYNDPCPSTVIEALACGLPVVYSASGGVPELVGPEAGEGVASELSWEEDLPPDPVALASAVAQVAQEWRSRSEAARQRAVEHLDLRGWVDAHRAVFARVLDR